MSRSGPAIPWLQGQVSGSPPDPPANFFGPAAWWMSDYPGRNLHLEIFNGNLIHVGVAEWKVARNPDALRTTLGSCVGIVLYAAAEKIGGIAHILLAEPPAGKIVNKGKYARTAIEGLVADLKKEGITEGLSARIFGGASMFTSFNSSFLHNIGSDNISAARDTLEKFDIPVLAEDIGGTAGRAITVYLDDGRVLLRANGKERYFYKA